MNKIIKHTQFIQSKQVKLAVYEWGKSNPDQQSIVLLHGYPDSAEVWDTVAEKLSAQFHVISYDVRGAGLSDIPATQHEFHSDFLIDDLIEVISTTSPNQAVHLVSYDWGSLQAWEGILDDKLKPYVATYTAMTPSLDAIGWWFKRELKKNNITAYSNVLKRLVSSSYMGFFQLPILPEMLWRIGLHRVWPKVVGHLQKVKVQPSKSLLKDALHSIALYRENMRQPLLSPSNRKTTIPTHMVILTKDPFVPREISESMSEWVGNIEFSEINSNHWVMLSHADELASTVSNYIFKHSKKLKTA